MTGRYDNSSSHLHGPKGMAIGSKSGDRGQPSSIFKGENLQRSDLRWDPKVPSGGENPYRNEWNDLLDAIRNDTPYNED